MSVRCDRCGDGPYNPDLFPHWPTADAALDAVGGLPVEDLPRLSCPDCATVLRWQARNHDFSGWRRCRCEQLVPAHRAGADGLCGTPLRYCVRCGVHEFRPAPATQAVA